MFKNFNSQNLLIGILIVFIVFVFISRENFSWLNPPIIGTAANWSPTKQVELKSIPANKTCPPNSSLNNDICEYRRSIPKSISHGWRLCPNNYQVGPFSCNVINRTTQPTLTCNDGYIL